MASNMYKKYTESLVRPWGVGTEVDGGTLVIDADSGQAGVTLADSGGSTRVKTHADGSVTTYPSGGVGYPSGVAEVAVDGTWLFPVAGVTNGDTVPDSEAGTNRGTKVYRVTADGTLTLTVGTNVYVGIIDSGRIVGGVAPVQIGVAL